ncbi:cytochrome c-type biogenesis CcmF C-terminal domain-containing protein [Georgenia halophila]|uniref:Cytochrome c-type biogenesis CcmF C-terminal domain-containing protein n=1 Tax=Georgenia halophila TaxID=620889 RepID=A0ABP8LMZ5_9MICO
MSAAGTVLLAAAALLGLTAAVAWARAAAGRVRAAADATGTTTSERPTTFERAGATTTVLALAAVAGAVVLIEVALVRHDTSLSYVDRVSDATLPVYYRISALWSALEGSLLLWLLATAVVAALFVRRPRDLTPAGHCAAAAVLAALVAVFAVVTLVASPFGPAGMADAARPSPLLRDHAAMGVHPPLLYAGFTALAVPYALAVGGLATRTLGRPWARVVHAWTLGAWVLLSAGIVVGAWWSYAVLGWGGYWAWDPVENASLMPWLVATALLHTVGARTTLARGWAVGLAGAGLVLVLLGTFLTRSGVVESVHAFSTSTLGPVLLGVLGLATMVLLALLVRRRRDLAADAPAPPVLSRGGALQANRVLLVLVTAVVLVGSCLPAVIDAVAGDRVSVGPPWYARTLTPVAVVLLALMAVGPLLAARREEPRALLARLGPPAAFAALVTGVVGILVPDLSLAAVSGLAGFVLASATRHGVRRPRDRRGIGVFVAHLGIALGAVAVVAGGHGATTETTVPVGGAVRAGETTATLVSLDRREEPHRDVAEARVLLAEGETPLGTVRPELRWYGDQSTMLAGPAIRVEPFRDVYVTLLGADPAAGTATLRLAVTPMITWLWASAFLTIVGGVLAGVPARRRGGAPRRETAPERSPLAAAAREA